MKRIILWLFIILVVIFGISFSVLNAELVTLDYYFSKIEVPLSIVVVTSLAFGILLGIATSILISLKNRRELSRLRKKLKNKELEISNMRAIPVQDLR
ncbi:MAG: LapA family protein [Gammaproteobacteria bacterium]|nr:LapA family protein [Gammaproteobacteria bacterium]MCF6231228.1 LapA family protein [Gammaproteobacteria bacterium]